MMYAIEFLPESQSDLMDIRRCLLQYYPSTSGNFFVLLRKKLDLLKNSPYAAQIYIKRPSYRRLVVGDYAVFYKVNEDKALIQIYRMIHGSRDIERQLKN
ncbi:MAG: type II toxin-antitoxin system RelE/ParE family toxin [Oscillospiraceae bacterium]|nr:type II toxin-antitoxin system RelE/ParE family toxin [Oscillospiraceae bacterium]